MRHEKKGRKLGRTSSHRKAMLSNMAASLILHKQIKTTDAKAKEARRVVERLISYAKNDTTHYRRLAFAVLRNKEAIKILFEEIAPVYMNREGGYTRIIKLGRRPNDAAKVVLLQLVDMVGTETEKKKKTAKKTTAKKTDTVKGGKKTEKKSAEKTDKEETPDVIEVDAEEDKTAPELAPAGEDVKTEE